MVHTRGDSRMKLSLAPNETFGFICMVYYVGYLLGTKGATQDNDGSIGLCLIHPWVRYAIGVYYVDLLNAVERSVHLHGPSRLQVVNYFSIMPIAMHIMTAVKESHVFRITPQVVW